MAQVDVLVVGGGLAGTLLTWELQQRGLTVRLIYAPHLPSASRVAAGIINPVLGQRLVLQPDFQRDWQHAQQCYRQLEQRFGQTLLFVRPMLRVMLSAVQAERWQRRQQQTEYHGLLGEAQQHPLLHAPHGCFLQHHTAYLDIPSLLDALHHDFRQRGLLEETAIDYADIELTQNGVRWRQWQANVMVFCEGWRVCRNPWFQHLPMRPAKGDILTLHSAAELGESIINGGHWLCPRGGSRYLFGASYEADQTDERISPAAREHLLAQFRAMFPGHPAIALTAHHSGIRPATADKKPRIERHPRHPQLAVCNGFGSHGSLRIPRHVAMLADAIMRD